MVKYNDVSNALCKLLKTKFPTFNIYTEEIVQSLKRPCFHVAVIPVTSTTYSVHYNEENVIIDIAYFSDEKPDLQSEWANNDMANTLRKVLNDGFQVLDRYLKIEQLNFDIVDKVLHTSFNLMWYNINEVTLEYLESFDIMQRFNVSNNKEVLILLDNSIYISTNDDKYVLSSESEIESYR